MTPTRRTVLTAGAALPVLAAALPARAETARPGPSRPYGLEIPTAFPFTKKHIDGHGSKIAYVDEGHGQPVLFLHGNPTSSYLWRNIIPYVTAGYRAIAPDLIGMGDSSKPDIEYTFADHARYLEGFVDALRLNGIILVVHDWGSALGMRLARINPGRVSAMAYMEAIVPPALPVPGYEALPAPLADFFRTMRSAKGEELVLGQNFFVEVTLPEMGVVRQLSEAEMAAYRAPYPTRQSRLPTLQWPREIPIGGVPVATSAEVTANGVWLYETEIPKLLFHAEPGAITPRAVVAYMAATAKNIEVRFLGAGTHFLQEEHPHLIGQGLADWLRRI